TNGDARKLGVAVLLGSVRGVAVVDGVDQRADALVLDAVRRRLVIGKYVAQRRVNENWQEIALLESRHVPAVIEKCRGKGGHAVDGMGMVRRELQRHQGPHGESAGED